MDNASERDIEIEEEGNTVKEAIDIALKKLRLKRKDVSVKILSEGERGLFNMSGAKPAKVRITVKNSTQK